MEDILKLLGGLNSAVEKNNKVQQEFCGALLSKYIKEGEDVYKYVSENDREKIEKYINDGLSMFSKRKIKSKIKRMVISVFTGIATYAFARWYFYLPFSRAIWFFIIGTLIDVIIKLKINQIAFVVETKRDYERFVGGNLLRIRESEDVSKLWK